MILALIKVLKKHIPPFMLMSRQGTAEEKTAKSDPIYRNRLVNMLVNRILKHEKKSLAYQILYRAMKKIQQKTFTCRPSTTPFGLILGPDSPSVDEPCGGTLGFSGHWILTNVCVTQADILASASSSTARASPSP